MKLSRRLNAKQMRPTYARICRQGFLGFNCLIGAFFLSVVSALALDAGALSFNGSDLRRISNAASSATFRSQSDPDFVETLTVRQIASDDSFSVAVRALVARAKSESHGAKLKLLQRSNIDDVIIIYLADTTAGKVIYKAERLSGSLPRKGLLSVSYAAEFEPGNISDEQEAKIKTSAVDALARLDVSVAQTMLPVTP